MTGQEGAHSGGIAFLPLRDTELPLCYLPGDVRTGGGHSLTSLNHRMRYILLRIQRKLLRTGENNDAAFDEA